MEWLLQVADEIDDAVGALRSYCLGLSDLGVAAGAGAGAIGTVIWLGEESVLLAGATALLSAAAALKVRGSQFQSVR